MAYLLHDAQRCQPQSPTIGTMNKPKRAFSENLAGSIRCNKLYYCTLRALILIFSSLSVKRKRVHTMYTLDSINIPTTVKRNISLNITEFSGSTSGVMG